ncbi:MAG: DUF4105 domain-containing protein [Treponema sp.]|nr:DUF4105 domain-containing protein [Treponema sp.]
MRRISFFFLLLMISASAFTETANQYFPEKLSEKTKVSVISVNYQDYMHSFFSKNCLRIYDKESHFDKIIDFASFKNFNDTFFPLNFLLKEEKAYIKVEPFIDYFLLQDKDKVLLTEYDMDLTPKEIKYIYSFIKTMYEAMPDYSYDFDIISNNSETHISQILHDCYRMEGSKNTDERYSFSTITSHRLSYKNIDGSYILLPEKKIQDFSDFNFLQVFHKKNPCLTISLIILLSITILLTGYQVLVYFFENLFISSIYKTTQIFDFLLFFTAGLSGTFFLFQYIHSNQTLFQNNLFFMFLFPPHLLVSFTLFSGIQNRKLKLKYWTISAELILLYLIITLI